MDDHGWAFSGRRLAAIAVLLLSGVSLRRVWAADLTLPQPLKESAWISQVPWDEEVEGASEVQVLAQAKDVDPAVAAHAEWEVRTADESRRVARFRVPWIMNGLAAGAAVSSESRGFHPPEREVRRMVPLEPGSYVMAWLLDGERRSNVVKFRVLKPGEKPAAGEFLRIVQGEPRHAGELPVVELRARRLTVADPAVVDLEMARVTVDDRPLTPREAPHVGGLLPTMRVGAQVGAPLAWDRMKETVDAGGRHTIQVTWQRRASPPATLNTGTPLGDAWDAATAKLAPAPVLPAEVEGKVIDENGAAGGAYELELLGGAAGEIAHAYDETSDSNGRYSFAGIPTGEYELTCTPPNRKLPLVVIGKVVIDPSKRVAVDVSFEGKFAISGRVDRPAEDETPAGPAAGSTVRATFVSPDGNTEMNTTAVTAADGTYVIKGPFAKVSFVGVMSSPEPTPVKDIVAPREGVNFRLVSAAEERRRVQ
jgi:hypothetical protein